MSDFDHVVWIPATGEVFYGEHKLSGDERGGTLTKPREPEAPTTGEWYALRCRPPGYYVFSCGARTEYVTEDPCPHRIIVWPSENDPAMAKRCTTEDHVCDPVPYEQSMGDAVSWYELVPS